MRKILVALFIFAVLSLSGFSGCSDAKIGDDEVVQAKSNEVIIDDFAFEPKEIVVDAGTEVTWKQEDNVPHNVISGDSFKSEIMNKGEEFSFTFSEKGEYEYYCGIHPSMKGKIIVR